MVFLRFFNFLHLQLISVNALLTSFQCIFKNFYRNISYNKMKKFLILYNALLLVLAYYGD